MNKRHLNSYFMSVAFTLICFFVGVQQGGKINHTTATLSEARCRLAATSSGELVFFAGGWNGTGASARVDILNVSSGMWTTTTLSQPRSDLAATSSRNLVFFGGGWDRKTIYSQIDIYNISNGSWSTATLSQPRWGLAATTIGNLVLFGGGTNIVDIYDTIANRWTNTTLSSSRHFPAAVSIGNLSFFAGGYGSGYLRTADVYNVSNRSWSVRQVLSEAREGLGVVTFRDVIMFSGGATSFFCATASNAVDIYNVTSNTLTTFNLSVARCYPGSAVLGDLVLIAGGGNNGISYGGVEIDNITSYDIIDVYNITSNSWSTLNLSQPRSIFASISSQNKIFFGGGQINHEYSNVVDIFEFPLPPSSSTPISTSSTPSTTSTTSTSFQTPSISSSSSLTPTTLTTSTTLTSSNTTNSPQPNSPGMYLQSTNQSINQSINPIQSNPIQSNLIQFTHSNNE
jgi:hypothetical protein